MKLYNSFQQFKVKNRESVVTIGMFDSIHLGHQSVIDKVITTSRNYNLESIVVTFSNSPTSFFSKTNLNEFIFPVQDKIEQLSKLGIDHLIIIPFDEFISSISAKEFVEDLLINILNIKYLVLGYDNHFGRNREGSVDFIKHNYSLLIKAFSVKAVELNMEVVSSTLIKNLLFQGKMDLVPQYLNRFYYIKGIVIKGKQLGRQLGFKTANIKFGKDLFKPLYGVYAVKVIYNNKEYHAVSNVGLRPTIIDNDEMNVETHIFDFDKEIYDEEIKIIFVKRIRDEIKFNSLDHLKAQIQKDIKSAQNILAQIHVTT